MRVFWIVIALAVAGFAVALALPGGSERDPAGEHTNNEPPASLPISEDAGREDPSAPAERPSEPTPPAPQPAPAAPEFDTATAQLSTTESSPPTNEASKINESPDTPASSEVSDVAKEESEAPAAQDGPTGWAALTRIDPKPSKDPGLPIQRREDGSLKIGDRFTISGKGTLEEPYMLPWDLLVAVQEYYSPREGKKVTPEFIKFLNGKYVAIGGYLSFPLATPNPTECLVMLNQWDGCCIGVPPTPYDAIEVTLADPANRTQRFAVEGRIVGRFSVDPYLVGDWLVGLYLVDDARVDTSNARSAEEVYGSQLPQFQPSGG